MSQKDVEALELVYARWREGDFGAADILHPDVDVTWSPTVIDATGPTRGVEAMREMLVRWFEGLEDVRFEAERFVDLGDRVLVVALMRARGRGSGIEVAERYGHLWTLRHGKAVRIEDADPDQLAANVDVAWRFMDLGRHGDWSRLELLADDVIYRPIAEIAESGEYRGREAFRRYMDEFFAGEWAEGLGYECEMVGAGGDSVIVRVHLTGLGKASALPFDARVYVVLTLEHGRIVRIEDFLQSRDAAHAARLGTG